MSRIIVIHIVAVLAVSGCTRTVVKSQVESTARIEVGETDIESMVLVPLSVQENDRILISELAHRFGSIWSRYAEGRHLPVIPERGFPRDPVRLSSEEFRRTGTLSTEGISDLKVDGEAPYALFIWVADYGITWEPKAQVKTITLGFALVSGVSEKTLIEGQGNVSVRSAKDSFGVLEDFALNQLAIRIYGYFVPPEPGKPATQSSTEDEQG